MYHCSLTIQIFSEDPLLEKILREITPLERFAHHVQTYIHFSMEPLLSGDIVILDLPLEKHLEEIRAACKKGASIVFCTEQKSLVDIAASTYTQIDDLWLKPFIPANLIFHMQKILEKLKLKKDYHLQQIYLDTAINSIPDLVWFKDRRGAHLKVNDSFCTAVGKKKENIKGRGHLYIWDLKEEEYKQGEFICLESEDIVIEARKTCFFDEKVKSKNGMRQFKTYKSPLFDGDEIIGTVGIAHDVTDLENMGTELEIILRSIPFAILLKNSMGCIINLNDKFEEYFHQKKADVIGKDYTTWKNTTLKTVTNIPDEGYAEANLYFGGQIRILEIREEALFDIFHHLVGEICIYRDITLERTLEVQILHSANTDFLTGLYNRRFFYDYINKHRGTQQLSLLYVDLDSFKKVNDTLGHQAGDEALILSARLITDAFPHDLIARIGGDEFLIALLGEYSTQSLESKARALLHQMRQAFSASRDFEIMSASLGIASTTDPDFKIDELIKQSDLALYDAKQRGKSQYCVYTPSLQNAMANETMSSSYV